MEEISELDYVLNQNHFLMGNPVTVVGREWNYWKYVHCYHGTRIPEIYKILSDGLLLPTEEYFVTLLESLGITDIDRAKLRNVIQTNGPKIYVQLGRHYAWKFNDFCLKGPEKLRKYLILTYGERAQPYLDRIDDWEPAILELRVPIEHFDSSPIWDDIEKLGDNMLHDSLEDIDLSMETRVPIPPDCIIKVHDPMASQVRN